MTGLAVLPLALPGRLRLARLMINTTSAGFAFYSHGSTQWKQCGKWTQGFGLPVALAFQCNAPFCGKPCLYGVAVSGA
jgi:hypothetical protein